MLIGYARVSTGDQTTSQQVLELEKAGVERVYVETASGGRLERPELKRMLEHLRSGDVVVVWKLDRVSRSLRDLLRLLSDLEELEVGFRSLTENIETTSAAGRMLMQMLGVFAEYERELLRERTRLGVERARAEGRVGGRPSKLSVAQRREIRERVSAGEWSMSQAARLFGVHKSTISRLFRRT